MEGVPMFMLELVAAGSRIDLDGNAHQVRALQAQTPRKNGASITKGSIYPQVTPRTTRTKKQDIGSPREDIAMRRTKIYPFLGDAKRLTHSRGASAIFQKIREGACPPMLKHMIGRVILMTT